MVRRAPARPPSSPSRDDRISASGFFESAHEGFDRGPVLRQQAGTARRRSPLGMRAARPLSSLCISMTRRCRLSPPPSDNRSVWRFAQPRYRRSRTAPPFRSPTSAPARVALRGIGGLDRPHHGRGIFPDRGGKSAEAGRVMRSPAARLARLTRASTPIGSIPTARHLRSVETAAWIAGVPPPLATRSAGPLPGRLRPPLGDKRRQHKSDCPSCSMISDLMSAIRVSSDNRT